jgi:hypothetical protein
MPLPFRGFVEAQHEYALQQRAEYDVHQPNLQYGILNRNSVEDLPHPGVLLGIESGNLSGLRAKNGVSLYRVGP